MVLRAYDHGPPGMKGSPVVTLIPAFRSGLSGSAAVLVMTADPELRMTIEHEQLPPEQVSSHRRGWGAIVVQLGEALRERRG
jgi:hypothetical protein